MKLNKYQTNENIPDHNTIVCSLIALAGNS